MLRAFRREWNPLVRPALLAARIPPRGRLGGVLHAAKQGPHQKRYSGQSASQPPLPEYVNRINDRIRLHLRARFDIREPDDLDDFEYNVIFNEVQAGELLEEKPRPELWSRPQTLKPFGYKSGSSRWKAGAFGKETVDRGQVVKIASWNLSSDLHDASTRASAALEHLGILFGEKPKDLVVMLQGVRFDTLQTILANEWVQQNFVITDLESPNLKRGMDGGCDFTLMMIPRRLAIARCFRVLLHKDEPTDALVVDVRLAKDAKASGPGSTTEVLRLCTAQLEPCDQPLLIGIQELGTISRLMKGKKHKGWTSIRAAVTAGGVSLSGTDEPEFHRHQGLQLLRACEGSSSRQDPRSSSPDDNSPNDRGRGAPDDEKQEKQKRVPKILLAGHLKTLSVDEAQDTAGGIGSFGRDLRTRIEFKDVLVSKHPGVLIGIAVK